MYFQAFKTAGLAHVSYLLGDEGEALVVDPRRDIEVYLDALRARGLRLRYVPRHGYQRVSNLLGGMTAWKRLDLPVREGPPAPLGAVPLEALEALEEAAEAAPPSPS